MLPKLYQPTIQVVAHCYSPLTFLWNVPTVDPWEVVLCSPAIDEKIGPERGRTGPHHWAWGAAQGRWQAGGGKSHGGTGVRGERSAIRRGRGGPQWPEGVHVQRRFPAPASQGQPWENQVWQFSQALETAPGRWLGSRPLLQPESGLTAYCGSIRLILGRGTTLVGDKCPEF